MVYSIFKKRKNFVATSNQKRRYKRARGRCRGEYIDPCE